MRFRPAFLILLGLLLASATSTVHADDTARIRSITGRLGRICKNRVASQFSDAVMADITVRVGATMQESIDSGEITLEDIRRSGLSFDWKVNRRGTDPHGYCNVEYDGEIDDFIQW
jgi:hypothetical protein